MQMADEPNDRRRKRGQKEKKNDPTFAPFFAQRTRSPRGSAGLEGVSTVQREGDLKSFFVLVASLFRCLRRRSVLRDRSSFCNHALEPVELVMQLRLLSCYLLLLAARRRARFTRTPKHRHHLLAIQKKTRSATAPKIISGKVSAKPICNH